jgi:putative beta-lysine N-acetyltransferase
MSDTIEKIGRSIIQHGPYNQRIYLMKWDRRDTVEIFSDIDRLSKEKGYGKILLKVPMVHEPLLIKQGYAKEAVIPEYFKNRESAVFMCRYNSASRAQMTRENEIKVILTRALQRNKLPKTGKLTYRGSVDTGRPEDTYEMSRVYKKVFGTYPFPIFDANHLAEMIQQESTQYFYIRESGRIAALAGAEIDQSNQTVEMTDFATLPEHLGKGFAARLLEEMEKRMSRQGIRIAFSIARALSPAMNTLFSGRGYAFGGTLVNNTNIAREIESMHVWYKSL